MYCEHATVELTPFYLGLTLSPTSVVKGRESMTQSFSCYSVLYKYCLT